MKLTGSAPRRFSPGAPWGSPSFSPIFFSFHGILLPGTVEAATLRGLPQRHRHRPSVSALPVSWGDGTGPAVPAGTALALGRRAGVSPLPTSSGGAFPHLFPGRAHGPGGGDASPCLEGMAASGTPGGAGPPPARLHPLRAEPGAGGGGFPGQIRGQPTHSLVSWFRHDPGPLAEGGGGGALRRPLYKMV